MKHLLVATLLSLCTVTTAAATVQPAVIFSQEVIAINADGSLIPQVEIIPREMAGIQTHDFDLGRERLLRVHTNISRAEERGLGDVVATVERCYQYIEATTGRSLERGVMLYLIELDEIPYAYNFTATYDNASQWQEVRLALIERDAPLSGQHAPATLSDLLYDTLPHELGHDVLESIPQLMHDVDGDASHHTRWFIEGACEVLAKGFSSYEDPARHRAYLALRNVDSVLAGTRMRTELLNWSQANSNGMALESDLYGAAMLTMMVWTESMSLKELLSQLSSQNKSIRGSDLGVMMQEKTGMAEEEIFSRADALGKRLNEEINLAQLKVD